MSQFHRIDPICPTVTVAAVVVLIDLLVSSHCDILAHQFAEPIPNSEPHRRNWNLQKE